MPPRSAAFQLPAAVWLPHASVAPFSLQVLAVALLPLAGYVFFAHLVSFTVQWWMTAAWLAGTAVAVAAFVEVAAARRINFMSAVLQQDPRLVAGDAVAFALLKQTPRCGGSRELDTLQKSLVNLYRASFRVGRGGGGVGGVFDGTFTRRSLISCDYEQEDGDGLGVDGDAAGMDDDGWDDRRSWQTPDDPLDLNGRSAEQSTRASLAGGAGPASAAPVPPLRGHDRSADPSGAVALQRALLLHGVASGLASVGGSGPNTPRGGREEESDAYGNAAGSSYGTADSGMVSARSHRTAISTGSFALQLPMERSGDRAGQPAFMRYDPLADNMSPLPQEQLLAGVPDTGTSLLMGIVRQLSPGTPLSQITVPVNVLEPRSLLEKFADPFRHASILIDAAMAGDDDDARMRHVARFFLSPFYLQNGVRKPYNPIHGECFAARMELPRCGGLVVHYLAEQVSHHPPVTCVRAVCPGLFAYRAVYHAKTSLVSINCASSIGEGGVELVLYPPRGSSRRAPDVYSLSWPALYASGFLYGAMRLELGGTATITHAGSRARAQIDFARKGWISGEYDVVRAVFADSVTGAVDAAAGPRFEGHWNGAIFGVNFPGAGAAAAASGKIVVWDGPSAEARASKGRLLACDAGPVCASQSREVWQRLTMALRQQDVARAVAAKHEVEQAQRARRKALADRGERHATLMFAHATQMQAQQHATVASAELLDLSKWQETDAARQWFAAQVADVEIR